MDRRAVAAFLDSFESTCGEGALVDFLLEEFAELTDPTVEQAAEILDGVCCEFEELPSAKRLERAAEFIACLRKPSHEAAPESPVRSARLSSSPRPCVLPTGLPSHL